MARYYAVRFAVVTTIGGIALAIGASFVDDAYRRAFFVVGGGVVGAAIAFVLRSAPRSS